MIQLVENTLGGGILILAAAVLRHGLKGRVHPGVWLVLWAVCLARLLSPVSWRGGLSVFALPVLLEGRGPAPATGMPFIQPPRAGPAAGNVQTAAPGLPPVVWVYVLAAVAVAVWLVWSWLAVRRRVKSTVPLEKTDRRYGALPAGTALREGSMKGAPLTFGAVRPTVVLPPGLEGQELEYVLAHEGVHARRRDNLWHYVMALALTVHWFNPAVWLMAALLRRDVELSCDRAVLKRMGGDRRAEYANVLVTLSAKGCGGSFCRGFGQKGTKERVMAIMNHKKLSRGMLVFSGALLALALCAAAVFGAAVDASAVSSVTVSTRFRTPAEVQDYVLPEGESSELIRLINAYPKTVYLRGDTRENESLDVWMRLDCDDGGYYMLHYSYCSGFSWNPLHFGEDDYYSLLTRYDAAGRAGTTWKLDYDFDLPFIEWWRDTAWNTFV